MSDSSRLILFSFLFFFFFLYCFFFVVVVFVVVIVVWTVICDYFYYKFKRERKEARLFRYFGPLHKKDYAVAFLPVMVFPFDPEFYKNSMKSISNHVF